MLLVGRGLSGSLGWSGRVVEYRSAEWVLEFGRVGWMLEFERGRGGTKTYNSHFGSCFFIYF